jgi:hypothetical protein
MLNNTIFENRAGAEGGGIGCYSGSTLTIRNSILWGNAAALGSGMMISNLYGTSTADIGYSDVEGGQASVYIDTGCTLDWGAG